MTRRRESQHRVYGPRRTSRGVATVEEVKRRHEARIMKMRGVVGVGIGRKDGKDCIRIYVAEDSPKVLAALPQAIEEVPVEIVISGAFRAL